MAVITRDRIGGGALAGQILHVRNGLVMQNYGEGRVNPADYGNGILAAIAAANQAGDVIFCGPMQAALANATIGVSGVKLIGNQTEIIRSGNYQHLIKLEGNDIEMRGMFINGEGIANTGNGWGVWITGARVIMDHCEVSGQRGTTVTDGHGTCTRIDGDDVVITDYISRDAGYAALSMHNADRLTVDGANIIDPHRALTITGTVSMDWIDLRNIRAYRIAAPVIQADGAYLNMNISDGALLDELRMTNVSLEDGDMIAAGVSYNDADGHQMFKAQNTRRIVMDNVRLLHGSNSGTGIVRSMYIQAFQLNTAPEELIMRHCVLADTFVCSEKIGYFHAEDSYFGLRNNINATQNYAELFYRLYADHVRFDGCTFNLQGRAKAFAIYSLANNPGAATDRYEFRHNRFIGNRSSDQFLFKSHDTSEGNGSLADTTKQITLDRTNTMENIGSGNMHHSDDANEELMTDTDSSGNMLYDGVLGRHPAPGAGPAYFTSAPALPVPANGRMIWNVNYDPAFVGVENALLKEEHKGWISNGGAWRRWPT